MDRQTAKEVLFKSSYARDALLDITAGVPVADDRVNEALNYLYRIESLCEFYIKNADHRQVDQWIEAMNNKDCNGKTILKLVVSK